MSSLSTQPWSARLGRLLWWVVPILFLCGLYSDGLKVWFTQDDFNWLGLIRRVHSAHDLLSALFAPAAQGTIRPWSDRGFFLLFEDLFGLNSLPYRIFVFVTVALDVALVAWITRRITGSQVAGFLAAILWTANTALVTVMVWSSAYNEALCLLFLLTAMGSFMRYAETGRRAFWWCQLVIFTVGFGALEINVVYPALAAAYVLFVAAAADRRKLLLSLAPLFGISVAYFLIHLAVSPPLPEGPYAIHVDGRMFRTLAVYCEWSLRPATWKEAGIPTPAAAAILWIVGIAPAVFVIRQVERSRYLVLFFVSWFLIALAPVITLADHLTDYYLTIPLVGLAMLGGFGISRAFAYAKGPATRRVLFACAAIIPSVAYLAAAIPATRIACREWLDRSLAVRDLVRGVEAIHHADPGKAIVLDNLTTVLYDDAVFWPAFYPVGLDDVYLTPGSETSIHPKNKSDKLSRIALDPTTLWNAVANNQAVIYSSVAGRLRNETEIRGFRTGKPDELPRRVPVGNPLFAYLMGPTWSKTDAGFRWMPGRATVRLGGPRSAVEKLVLDGFCPESQLRDGMLDLTVSVDGTPLAPTEIDNPERNFRRVFALPPSLLGRAGVEVAISVDRLFHQPGERAPGLFFRTIAFESAPR